jgi:hypothetical protein
MENRNTIPVPAGYHIKRPTIPAPEGLEAAMLRSMVVEPEPLELIILIDL